MSMLLNKSFWQVFMKNRKNADALLQQHQEMWAWIIFRIYKQPNSEWQWTVWLWMFPCKTNMILHSEELSGKNEYLSKPFEAKAEMSCIYIPSQKKSSIWPKENDMPNCAQNELVWNITWDRNCWRTFTLTLSTQNPKPASSTPWRHAILLITHRLEAMAEPYTFRMAPFIKAVVAG